MLLPYFAQFFGTSENNIYIPSIKESTGHPIIIYTVPSHSYTQGITVPSHSYTQSFTYKFLFPTLLPSYVPILFQPTYSNSPRKQFFTISDLLYIGQNISLWYYNLVNWITLIRAQVVRFSLQLFVDYVCCLHTHIHIRIHTQTIHTHTQHTPALYTHIQHTHEHQSRIRDWNIKNIQSKKYLFINFVYCFDKQKIQINLDWIQKGKIVKNKKN